MNLKDMIMYAKLFYYKRVFNYTVVSRFGAIGDAFLFIPVAKALKEQKKAHKILFLSHNVFFMHDNDYIDKAWKIRHNYSKCKYIDFNLDNVSENDGFSHTADAYAKVCGVKINDYVPQYKITRHKFRQEIQSLENSIVIDLGDTWSNRQLSIAKLQSIVDYFAKNHKVCTIGRGSRSLKNCTDLMNKTNENELAYILAKSRVVLSQDSFILHLAEAVGAKIVACFGSTLPEYRVAKNYQHIKIVEDRSLECRGCRHHTAAHFVACKWGDDRCMANISAESVINAMNDFL